MNYLKIPCQLLMCCLCWRTLAPLNMLQHLLVPVAIWATPHVLRFMIPVAPLTFPHTEMISKILLRLHQRPSKLPISKTFKLLEKVRWLLTYQMELTSRNCASWKFCILPRFGTPLFLLDDSMIMVFRPPLEVASVPFEVLMAKNLVLSPR